EGYDPVSYFSGTPTPGKPEFELEWSGAKWRFASSENKSSFQADPARYAPQYGGACALASSLGSTTSSLPTSYDVINGKLYLYKGSVARWLAHLLHRVPSA